MPLTLRQVIDNLLGSVRSPAGTATTIQLYDDGHGTVIEVADSSGRASR